MYADTALNLALKIKYTEGIADAYIHKGSPFILTGQLDTAEILIKKALKFYDEINNADGNESL